MKNIICLILFAISLFSCSDQNSRSDAYGNFEAVEVIVSALAQGKILELSVEEGDVLMQGQEVGLIDTTDLALRKRQLSKQKSAISSRIASIDAQARVQEQQLSNYLVDQERTRNLFQDGAATKKQLDDINGAVDLIKEQIQATRVQKQSILDEIEAMEMQIQQVEEMLNDCYIENPVKGTVLVTLSEQGEVANFGKPLYKIANLEVVKLKVYVSGAQLPVIKLGQTVEVLVDKDKETNRAMEGKVSWISQTAEFTPKTIQTKEERVSLVYAVKIDVVNDGTLKIGMPGEVNFSTGTK